MNSMLSEILLFTIMHLLSLCAKVIELDVMANKGFRLHDNVQTGMM
jgi:hypothetical protein